MSKTVDLQPFLDYFEMLKVYEQKGFLQMEVEKHEAYITKPALYAVTPGDDPQLQLKNGFIKNTVCRLRTYAAFLSMKGKEYMAHPFAINVVKDEPPHDMLHTILLERRRRWWSLWFNVDSLDVVNYGTKTTAP